MLDQRRTDDGRQEHTQVLKPSGESHDPVGAAERRDVGRDEDRGIDEAHACLTEQAMAQVGQVVASKVLAHLLLERRFTSFRLCCNSPGRLLFRGAPGRVNLLHGASPPGSD